ncbi:hypothetical protein E2I00_003292, partial [Balaenoptera physalus]
EAPSQPPAPPKEVVAQNPVHYEMTVPKLRQDRAQHSNLPSVTVKPLDQGLPTAPEPTTEAEHSAALQQTAVPPTYPEVTLPNPEQVQAQHPTLTEITVQPLDLELTIRPEPTKEDEPSPTMQETLTQPPEPPKEVFVAQPPVYQNPIVPTQDQDHTEPPTSPSLTTTPEPATECEHSTALQQTTTPPPKHPEVTLAQPSLTQVTIQPMDVELTVTAGSNMETVHSPIMQETPTQPPEAPQEVLHELWEQKEKHTRLGKEWGTKQLSITDGTGLESLRLVSINLELDTFHEAAHSLRSPKEGRLEHVSLTFHTIKLSPFFALSSSFHTLELETEWSGRYNLEFNTVLSAGEKTFSHQRKFPTYELGEYFEGVVSM